MADRSSSYLAPRGAAGATRSVLPRSSGESHASERGHQDPVSGDTRAPTEVQIRVFAVESLVEQIRSVEDFTGDQHRGRRDAQHLEDAIELPLIDLARLQRRRRMAESIRRAADVPKRSRMVAIDDLGADDPDVLDADPTAASTRRPTASLSSTAWGSTSRTKSAAFATGRSNAARRERADPSRCSFLRTRRAPSERRSISRASASAPSSTARTPTRGYDWCASERRQSRKDGDEPGPTTSNASTLGVDVPVDATAAAAGEVIRVSAWARRGA